MTNIKINEDSFDPALVPFEFMSIGTYFWGAVHTDEIFLKIAEDKCVSLKTAIVYDNMPRVYIIIDDLEITASPPNRRK